MQNRYVGDIGDFGKYGMLRSILSDTGIHLGVNWYLVADESHTNDGKYTEYLNPSNKNSRSLEICDASLYRNLRRIVSTNNRCIAEIQNSPIMPPNAVYYSKQIPNSSISREQQILDRRCWFENSLPIFSDCDVLFLDPDNGLEIASEPIGSGKCAKYVLYDEVNKYFKAGFSLIIYNHRDRSCESVYEQRFIRIKESTNKDIELPVLRFIRYSVRDYVFVMQNNASPILMKKITDFMTSLWSKHWQFRMI